jgi:hypothetical protein
MDRAGASASTVQVTVATLPRLPTASRPWMLTLLAPLVEYVRVSGDGHAPQPPPSTEHWVASPLP